MVSEIIKGLVELLKLAPRYLITLGLTSAFLLFLNQKALEFLGLYDFSVRYKLYLGICLVFTTLLFGTYVVSEIFLIIRSFFMKYKQRKFIIERLDKLTEDEKQILRFYVANNTRANTLKIDDGVVKGLVNSGIIYQSASLGNLMDGFAHNISNVAWDHLHKNLNLLEGNTNTYRTDKTKPYWDRI